MNSQDTIRKLEQSIDEAKKQIEILKKPMRPVPKAGQVWKWLGGVYVVINSDGLGKDNRGKWYCASLRGHLVDGPVERAEDLYVGGKVSSQDSTLLAESLAEYFEQQKAS
jgi:hypothetical protein